MKKLLLGTVALVALGLGAPANAADMRARPLPPPVAVWSWTGCHVGGAAGNEWGNSDGYSTTAATTLGIGGPPTIALNTRQSSSFKMTGFTGGFYAGCDYQAGLWVFGIEGDWSVVNKEGQAFEIPPFNTNFVNSAKERWIATARARLGYAVDKWLLYVTGGAAWVKLDSAEWNILFPLLTPVLQSDTRTGWTVGAGLDYALSYGWSIRSEYLYVQIPSYTTFTPGVGAGTVPGVSHINVSAGRLTNNILRAGLTYKFW